MRTAPGIDDRMGLAMTDADRVRPTDAVAWFARLRALPGPTASEREDFARWLSADPANADEFAGIERLWRDGGRDAAALAAMERDALDRLLARMDAPTRPRPSLSRTGGRRLAALRLACLILCLMGGGYWWRHPHMIGNLMASESTAPGERRTIALSDGSTLDLDADGAVDIDFTESERRITLTRGRLHVTVAHDPDRPLTVVTDRGAVRAVGTRFEVERCEDATTVTVTEGRVAVTGSHGGAIGASAGQRVRMRTRGPRPLPPVDPATVAAWREGRLVFRDAPLARVVEAIARHSPTPVVVLADAERLNARRVSGSFPADDSAGALSALRDAFGLRVDRIPGLAILIR